MSTVGYNRVVDVNVEISNRFPTVANFGIPLIITRNAGATALETVGIKAFDSLDAVRDYGFTVADTAYQTAAALLGNRYAPNTFKIGYIAEGIDLGTGLGVIDDTDSLFYAVILADLQRRGELDDLNALNNYCISNRKIAFFDSPDFATRDDPLDTVGLAPNLRDVQPSRLAGFYTERTGGGNRNPTGRILTNTDTNERNTYPSRLIDGVIYLQAFGVEVATVPLSNDGFGGVAFEMPAGINAYTGPYRLNMRVYGSDILDARTMTPDDIADSEPFVYIGETDVINNPDFNFSDGNFVAIRVRDPLSTAPIGAEPDAVELYTSDIEVAPVPVAGGTSTTSVAELPFYYAARMAAYVSSVDYNQRDSHYTAKFKRLEGAKPSSLTNLQAQNLTGFLPATGQNPTAGGFLNAYICTAGQNFVVEGTMMDGSFIDLVTFEDWLVATMQRRILTAFLNNKVVPYDLVGVAMIVSAVAATLQSALLARALTDSRTDEEGNILPAFDITVAPIGTVDPALQDKRIAPDIKYCARYAGAIHFAIINGTIKTAN